MFSFLQKFFKKPMQRVDLSSLSLEDRVTLAQGQNTKSEVFQYLAYDVSSQVRLAVAANRAAPLPLSSSLAQDSDPDVRLALAGRLVSLLPMLSVDKYSQLYVYVVQALGTLAHDKVLSIRRALASSLKDQVYTPPNIAAQLARDVERDVSEPILRFCLALPDETLLQILKGHPQSWVIAAIASRPQVTPAVSDAVIDTYYIEAGTVLLNNTGATIERGTLEKIVERAKTLPEWQAPVALRKELSADLAQRLIPFVGEAVLSLLQERTDLNSEDRSTLAQRVQKRVSFAHDSRTAEERVQCHIKAGTLDGDLLSDAIAAQDLDFVTLALSFTASIPPLIVEKMLKSGGARPIIALCWQAGMPMRLAVTLQKEVARLPPKDLVYARGGTDYPLTPEEMRWQLEFFGITPSVRH